MASARMTTRGRHGPEIWFSGTIMKEVGIIIVVKVVWRTIPVLVGEYCLLFVSAGSVRGTTPI